MSQRNVGAVRVRSGTRSGQNCYKQPDNSWFCPETNVETMNCLFWNRYQFSWDCYKTGSNEVVRGSSENAEAIKAMLDQYVADMASQGIGARCEHESYLDRPLITSLNTNYPFATCYKEGKFGTTCATNPDDSWYCKNRNGFKYITGAGGEAALKQYMEESYASEGIHWK